MKSVKRHPPKQYTAFPSSLIEAIPEARIHDLRHTFAVNSIRAGDDIKTVQGNLGHSTAAFTLDDYGHYTDDMKRASANIMEAFIGNIYKALMGKIMGVE